MLASGKGHDVVFASAFGDFRILTVCTGNICRSPAVKRLLIAGLGDSATVTSAGTHALVGESIDHSIGLRLRRRGVSEEGFRARQLKNRHILGAALVLPLTTWHRARILEQMPSARDKTFTLLELARIVGAPEFPALPEGSVPKRLRAMVRLAAKRRGIGVYVSDDDVPDPYGKGPELTEVSFQMMEIAVNTIVGVALGDGKPQSGVRTA